MIKKIVPFFLALALLLNISGCATVTGPSVSREEIRKARDELKVKALAYQIKQLERVDSINIRLLRAIPQEDLKKPPQAYFGMRCLEIDRYLKRLYNLNTSNGVVAVLIQKDSPASQAGIQPGDIILSINNKKTNTLRKLSAAMRHLKIGQSIQLEIIRNYQRQSLAATVGQISFNCPVILIDEPEVNAATDGRSIYVMYGLLNFAKSDDEIAAVLGHELAHAVRGHVRRSQGGQLLTILAAVALGIVAEHNAPGSGSGVMRGVGELGSLFNVKFSRDLEREADYFGTKFVYYSGFDVEVCATVEERFAIEIPASMTESYLSTHPSSPERVARIRKTIAELKANRKD